MGSGAKGWPGIVSVFAWVRSSQPVPTDTICLLAGRGPAPNRQLSLQLHEQRSTDRVGWLTKQRPRDNSGRDTRLSFLSPLFWTPALGWGYPKGAGALKEVVQGAQPYILEWSALVWLWGCRSCSISPHCPSQSHRFSLETPERESKRQRLQI